MTMPRWNWQRVSQLIRLGFATPADKPAPIAGQDGAEPVPPYVPGILAGPCPCRKGLFVRMFLLGGGLFVAGIGYGHEGTFHLAGEHDHEQAAAFPDSEQFARVKLRFTAPSDRDVNYALVRVTPAGDRTAALAFENLVSRAAGWYSLQNGAVLRLPREKLTIEAVHGLATSVTRQSVDLTAMSGATVNLPLHFFYDPKARHIIGGNTHLHLIANAKRQIGFLIKDLDDADRYLQCVGGSDDLDLLYVSHLTRPERTYISNDYSISALKDLSNGRRIFGNGIEHRHGKSLSPSLNGTTIDGQTVVMAYGHVLLLNLLEFNIPESIGPGLTAGVDATDVTPLRTGIQEAHRQGGAAVWCHGTQGIEGIPDWVSGVLDAQNIYDGGSSGTFETVFYRYLNAGIKVPFSTGTDWGVWDFSRVYVPVEGEVTSRAFLQALREGRSYITNGPFVEFTVDEAGIGDTVALPEGGMVHLKGRALGRTDFLHMQVVQNGTVIHEVATTRVGDHFEASVDLRVKVEHSGWLALRILPAQPYSLYDPVEPGPGINIFHRALFAHTSPIYQSVAGQPIFDRDAVESLLRETRLARKTVDQLGVFANDRERERAVRLYREAETALEKIIRNKGSD
ncbi:MAG: CehA/McbA family metallohydrolase [Opitutaceae bacterium]|nr:CehA/McbA family metallohydrolase [Opitutaceae bacterium]